LSLLSKPSEHATLYIALFINLLSMNFTRALGFAVIVYAVGAAILFLTGYHIDARPQLVSYITLWILMIPVLLFVAKWYFHIVPPTAKAGLYLGLLTIALGFLLDTSIVLISGAWDSLSQFYGTVYGDWKFFLTMIELLLLTTYAGYEFDATYTKKSGIAE